MREQQHRPFRRLPPTRANTLRKMSANTQSPERSLREQSFACWGTYFTDAIDGGGRLAGKAELLSGIEGVSTAGAQDRAAGGLRVRPDAISRAGVTEDPPGSAHVRPPCNRADAVTRGRQPQPVASAATLPRADRRASQTPATRRRLSAVTGIEGVSSRPVRRILLREG